MSTAKTIKSAIESMMFIWGEPLSVKDVADIFNIERKEALGYFKELKDEYEQEGRGIVIREVNKAFQFTTRAENLPYIERLCTPVRRRKLTQSALETLAIVAYRQPVTKGEIESVRGIRCDRVMEGLVKKGLVEEVGRSDSVGRPILYGTTDTFLKQFGLENIRELPDIKDIEGLIEEAEAPEGFESVVGQISLDELSGDEATAEPAEAQAPDEAPNATPDDADAPQAQDEAPNAETPVAEADAAEPTEAPESEVPAEADAAEPAEPVTEAENADETPVDNEATDDATQATAEHAEAEAEADKPEAPTEAEADAATEPAAPAEADADNEPVDAEATDEI